MYHGADYSSHLLAKVGGFLLLPCFGALASKLLAQASESALPNQNQGKVAALAGTVAHGALAYALYSASESDSHSDAVQSFLRGGAWGEGLSSAVCATVYAVSESGPMAVTSGKFKKADQALNLLTAQAAAAVAAKRAKKFLPAAVAAVAAR